MATKEAEKIARILENAHANGKAEKSSTRNIMLVAIYFADETAECGSTEKMLKPTEVPNSMSKRLDDAIKLKGYVKLTEEGHRVIRKALLDS